SSTDRSASANPRACRAASPASPLISNGSPTTTVVTSFSRTSAAMERRSFGAPVLMVPSATPTRRSASRTATPFLAAPRSCPVSAAPRPGRSPRTGDPPSGSVRARRERRANRGQRGLQPGGIGSAREGQAVLPPHPAADERSDLLEELAGVDGFEHGLVDGGD